MERASVILKLEKALSSFGESKASVKFESDDVVKVEIVSNLFKDVILTKRIDMVSKAILDISTTDLIDYNIAIIALTENEAKLALLSSKITTENLHKEEENFKIEGHEVW